jgi:hypothetical protein
MARLPSLNPDQLLDTEELAALENRSKWAIIADRKYGRGIPYVRVGRSIRYRVSDITAYLDANTVTPGQPKADKPVTKAAPAPVRDIRSIPPHLRGMRGFR